MGGRFDRGPRSHPMSVSDPSILPGGTTATAVPQGRGAVPLRVGYQGGPLAALLADPQVLAVFGFGPDAPAADPDPRYLHVGLAPVGGDARWEVWRVDGAVESGREAGVAWSRGGGLAFGAIEVDEAGAGGLADAARTAYATLLDHVEGRRRGRLVRLWNYLDAITEGQGDAERYRQFSIGRARGMDGRMREYPAATAIGRRDGRRVLQVYWLAAAEPGTGIENPRQVSAYRYPRQYGPQPPSFARATLPADPRLPLMLSGTASVVGHASAHPGDIRAQVAETFRNLDSLVEAARARRPALSPAIGSDSLLKAYVRHAEDAGPVASALAARLPDPAQALVLVADICREDLLVEVDGFHA